MSENIVDDAVLTGDDQHVIEPEPGPRPTPEEEEEWERERMEAWNAKIQPFHDLRTQVDEHDDLMADALYELTLLELGLEE